MASIKSLIIIVNVLCASSPELLNGASSTTTLLKKSVLGSISMRYVAAGAVLVGLGYGVYQCALESLRQLRNIKSLSSLCSTGLSEDARYKKAIEAAQRAAWLEEQAHREEARRKLEQEELQEEDQRNIESKELGQRAIAYQEQSQRHLELTQLARPAIQWNPVVRLNDEPNDRPQWRHWRKNQKISSSKQSDIDANHAECMLMGYKNVSENLVVSPEKEELLRQNGIRTLSYYIEENSPQKRIWYTPQGTINALLLLKLSVEKDHNNPYIAGLLLGYPPRDIAAHQMHLHELNKLPTPKKAALKALHEQAQMWITENSPTIEQWIRDNTATLKITVS